MRLRSSSAGQCNLHRRDPKPIDLNGEPVPRDGGARFRQWSLDEVGLNRRAHLAEKGFAERDMCRGPLIQGDECILAPR